MFCATTDSAFEMRFPNEMREINLRVDCSGEEIAYLKRQLLVARLGETGTEAQVDLEGRLGGWLVVVGKVGDRARAHVLSQVDCTRLKV